jgi:hypothetical protein
VLAVVESMNGARFVHDQLELAGWDVRRADPQRRCALAPLAYKTDRIDACVLHIRPRDTANLHGVGGRAVGDIGRGEAEGGAEWTYVSRG